MIQKDKKCKTGEILREAYDRKSYHRKGYVKKDGTMVPSTYVHRAHVPATCITDRGKPGKGSKILPKPDNI